MSDEKYFNFPISLLEGLMTNKMKVLRNIFDYSIYQQILDYEYGDEEVKLMQACDFFGVKAGNPTRTLSIGSGLHDKTNCKVKVGININVYFDYYQNEKSDFEMVCLLAFLAIKSVLHKNQSSFKLTNLYWLSRMDGKEKAVKSIEELSPEIRQYANRYQLEKIKEELQLNWNLVQYGRYTRGFYVSLKMSLEDLIVYAEGKRRNRLKKQLKDDQKRAIQRAMNKLNNSN